jgi:Flp pilus assembly protein TadG
MVFGTPPPSAPGDHRARQRGAALVEFAIVAPVLFAILLGIFTGGLAFNRKLALTNGVREGSRFGATLGVAASTDCGSLTTATLDCWLTQVANTVVQAAEGELGSTVAARSICVAFVHPDGTTATDQTRRLVRTSSGDAFTSGSTCFSDGRASSESRVQVTASRDAQIEFVFATRNVTLSTQSVSRFEAVE